MTPAGARRYRCLARCGEVSIQAAAAEASIYAAVSASIGSQEALGRLVADHIEALRKSAGNVDALRRRIEMMRKKEERGARALIHASSDTEEAALRDELGKVRAARQEYEARLAEIGSVDEALASVESARRALARSLGMVERDPQLRRGFLSRLVREVHVRGKRLTVMCQLSTSVGRSGQFLFTVEAEVA